MEFKVGSKFKIKDKRYIMYHPEWDIVLTVVRIEMNRIYFANPISGRLVWGYFSEFELIYEDSLIQFLRGFV